MALRSFKGGIHPPEHKDITENSQFSNLSIPQKCYIPLQQHIGKPAIQVVSVGDSVTEGQVLGEADGFISAPVHASIPGKVIGIKECPTVYSRKSLCVIIEAEGSFTSFNDNKNDDTWKKLSKAEIKQKISEAGIVGMGGAAFPTAVKLSPPENKPIDTLIINGAECEPYLTTDDMLMQTFPGDIIEGIQITLKSLNLRKAVIGVESNTPKAIKALKNTLLKTEMKEDITVKPVRTKYPQGAEKQLIYSLLKREVPSGGLPMETGVVVQNIGTIFAIREALVLGKPLFERYVTVTGELVNNPGNYKVRIGTLISDLIEECGGLKGEPAKIIMGGPMCGTTLDNLDIPVVKGTSGILFLSDKEVSVDDYRPCIRCGRCVTVCPIRLLPNELANAIEINRLDIAQTYHPFDCIMCGSCSYSCPSRRPISHFIKLGQQQLRKKK